jgi:hypothetical protein
MTITKRRAKTAQTQDRARRAVSEFRKLQPTLTAYARNLTGKRDVAVEMSVQSNGHTDGKKIFMKPPVALGDAALMRHERFLCDKRDPETLQQQCVACRTRERILAVTYHEIAHLAFDSFLPTTRVDADTTLKIIKAVFPEWYFKRVQQKFESNPDVLYGKKDYAVLAQAVNPYFAFLVNALEDVRINERMADARPGTRIMQAALLLDAAIQGVEQKDKDTGRTVWIRWSEYPTNHQITLAAMCIASGLQIQSDWFEERVVEDAKDADLVKLLTEVHRLPGPGAIYQHCFPVYMRLRELGYFQLTDEEPPPEESEDGEVPDVPQPASEDGSGGEGDDGSDGSDAHGSEGEEPGDEGEADGGDPPDGEGGSDGDPSDDAGSAERGAGGPDDADAGDSGGGPSDGGTDPSGADGGSEQSGDPNRSGSSDGDGGSDQRDRGGDQDDLRSDRSEGTEGSEGAPSPGGPGDSGALAGGSDAGDRSQEQSPDESSGVDDSADPATGSDAGPATGGVGEDSGPEPRDAGDGAESEPGDGAEDGLDSEGSVRNGGGAVESAPSEADDDPADGGLPGEDASGTAEGDRASAGDGAEAEGSDQELHPEDGDTESGRADDADAESDGDDPGSSDRGSSGDGSDQWDDGGQPSEGESSGPGGEVDLHRVPGEHDGEPDESVPGSEDRESDDGTAPGEDRAIDETDEALDYKPDAESAIDLTDRQLKRPPVPPTISSDENLELIDLGVHPEVDEGDDASEVMEKAVESAIIQSIYFEMPSQHIPGLKVWKYDDRADDAADRPWHAWEGQRYSDKAASRRGQIIDPVGEQYLGPALMRMRMVFADNQRSRRNRNQRSGRIDTRTLGKRGWSGDDRLFGKKVLPGKKDYFVAIFLDISGSTVGVNIKMIKEAALAQAELCHRMGIKFAVYGHTGSWISAAEIYGDPWVDLYEIKAPEQPWDDKSRAALMELNPSMANLDGHTLEFARKLCDKQSETNKVILYYSDGAMPLENHDEELEILQREIATCRSKGYTLLGVGVRTDSPSRHGLDTVQIDSSEEVGKVVTHLERNLVA